MSTPNEQVVQAMCATQSNLQVLKINLPNKMVTVGILSTKNIDDPEYIKVDSKMFNFVSKTTN